MCLKQQIINNTKEICNILEDSKLQENLLNYEIVRLQGNFNMLLNPYARQVTGLTKEEYMYIINNYSELMTRFPDTRDKAMRTLLYIKSAEIAKLVAIYGCKECIEIVSKKLDVNECDLCENCRKILTEHKT